MALFVDGPACTIDELVDQDAGLLETAQNCGINLTTKVRLAAQEVESEIQVWLDRPRSLIRRFSAGGLRIDQVVVTPPLREWLAMHSLELVYRDGYFSQLVDRYQAKWVQYAKLAREARDGFVARGLGIVSDPMSLAAPPVLGTVEGSQQGGTFYARVAWVNAAGQAGAASAASTITFGDGHLMTVLLQMAREMRLVSTCMPDGHWTRCSSRTTFRFPQALRSTSRRQRQNEREQWRARGRFLTWLSRCPDRF